MSFRIPGIPERIQHSAGLLKGLSVIPLPGNTVLEDSFRTFPVCFSEIFLSHEHHKKVQSGASGNCCHCRFASLGMEEQGG